MKKLILLLEIWYFDGCGSALTLLLAQDAWLTVDNGKWKWSGSLRPKVLEVNPQKLNKQDIKNVFKKKLPNLSTSLCSQHFPLRPGGAVNARLSSDIRAVRSATGTSQACSDGEVWLRHRRLPRCV